jgi:predicted nucleic acid-binding Zn ribbon protein
VSGVPDNERETPRVDAAGAAGPATPDGPRGAATPDGPRGPELARAVLDAAKVRRDAAGSSRSSTRAGGTRRGSGKRARGYSGPGPDARDPQLFGTVLARLIKQRGWQQPAAEGQVFGAWERVVGPDLAAHCRPVKLVDGELTVEAESTAWATQLRLLAGRLLRQIAKQVGPNVVTRLHIHGPSAPTWSRGPRRVPGRGPRDTYG